MSSLEGLEVLRIALKVLEPAGLACINATLAFGLANISASMFLLQSTSFSRQCRQHIRPRPYTAHFNAYCSSILIWCQGHKTCTLCLSSDKKSGWRKPAWGVSSVTSG